MSVISHKAILFILYAVLAFSSFMVKGQDLAYLGEGLMSPAIIDLMDETHPVSYDFVGKEIYLDYESTAAQPGEESLVAAARFVDGENMEWWVESETPKTIRNSKYVIFKISEGIYFVTWVDARASNELGPPTEASLFDDNYLVAFVLDVNKMVATDAYMRPSAEGLQQFHLAQASVVVKDIVVP